MPIYIYVIYIYIYIYIYICYIYIMYTGIYYYIPVPTIRAQYWYARFCINSFYTSLICTRNSLSLSRCYFWRDAFYARTGTYAKKKKLFPRLDSKAEGAEQGAAAPRPSYVRRELLRMIAVDSGKRGESVRMLAVMSAHTTTPMRRTDESRCCPYCCCVTVIPGTRTIVRCTRYIIYLYA